MHDAVLFLPTAGSLDAALVLAHREARLCAVVHKLPLEGRKFQGGIRYLTQEKTQEFLVSYFERTHGRYKHLSSA